MVNVLGENDVFNIRVGRKVVAHVFTEVALFVY